MDMDLANRGYFPIDLTRFLICALFAVYEREMQIRRTLHPRYEATMFNDHLLLVLNLK